MIQASPNIFPGCTSSTTSRCHVDDIRESFGRHLGVISKYLQIYFQIVHLQRLPDVMWTTSVSHLGDICESHGRHLGVIWTTSGSHMDDIWESYGRHLGVVWTTSGSHVDDIWESVVRHPESKKINRKAFRRYPT